MVKDEAVGIRHKAGGGFDLLWIERGYELFGSDK